MAIIVVAVFFGLVYFQLEVSQQVLNEALHIFYCLFLFFNSSGLISFSGISYSEVVPRRFKTAFLFCFQC
jgi:hypothetical protein